MRDLTLVRLRPITPALAAPAVKHSVLGHLYGGVWQTDQINRLRGTI